MTKAKLVCRDQEVIRVTKVLKDHRGFRGQEACRDPKDIKEVKELLDTRVHKVSRGIKVGLGTLACRAIREDLVHKVRKAK